MTPWFSKLPNNWSRSYLKWLAVIYAGGTPSKENASFWTDGAVPWLNSGAVNQKLILTPSAFISDEALKNSSAKWVPEGALVIGLAGQGKTKGMVAQIGLRATINQSLAAIVPARIQPRYLFWFLEGNYRNIRGLSSDDLRDGLNLEIVGAIDCPIPPRETQSQIADFLDRETAEADALVAKYERLIELLEEKRVALITQAVTKGLDPSVPMKDSGIPFIDNVPAHWTVLSLRRLASVRGGTAVPEEYLTDDESAIPFFKVGDIESADAYGVMREARSFVVRSAAGSAAGTRFAKDTIVLAKRGAALLLNRFRQTGKAGFFDSNLMGLSVNTCKLQLRFGLHVLSIVDLVQFVKPGAIPSIDAPEIKNLVIALPPVREQTLIVNYIDGWMQRIAIEISLTQRAVALVREHRSALITAAVTGEIDVNTYRSKPKAVEVPA